MKSITISIIVKNNINEIHIGDKIHHHDQFIIFNNFKVMNTIVNKPIKPIPLSDD